MVLFCINLSVVLRELAMHKWTISIAVWAAVFCRMTHCYGYSTNNCHYQYISSNVGIHLREGEEQLFT